MPRAAMCPAPSRPPAQTTMHRDACRSRAASQFLRRGGRPRRSNWWRAWLARLLPSGGAAHAMPPAPVSASLALATEILTITFDQDIDGVATTADAAQFVLTDGITSFPGASYVDLVGAVLRVQMDLPGTLPIELTCSLLSGAGVVIGLSGLEVAPFAGVPVVMA